MIGRYPSRVDLLDHLSASIAVSIMPILREILDQETLGKWLLCICAQGVLPTGRTRRIRLPAFELYVPSLNLKPATPAIQLIGDIRLSADIQRLLSRLYVSLIGLTSPVLLA